MIRDTLYLLKAPFTDPALPGRSFFCPHAQLVLGALAAAGERATKVDVVYVGFEKPRDPLPELVGEENQGGPTLVLAGDDPDGVHTGQHAGRFFVKGTEAILHALHVRHDFPEAHP